MLARFPGSCAATGQAYPAGTPITKGATGWEIARGAHAADFRRIEFAPLAPEFGGTADDKSAVTTRDVNLPLVCACCKTLPGFDQAKPETFAACRWQRQGDTLTCPRCGRTANIMPPLPPPPPETRTCWECGRPFTYAECKKYGGDWNENGGYCGC